MNMSRILVFTALMLWGCHGNSTTDNTTQNNTTAPVMDTVKHTHADAKPLANGIIIDTVHCIDIPSQVYSIYLPTNYSSAKKWPVVYFFDPHGVGNLPLKLYKALAQKYGFIIAGTYGSK